MIDFSWSHILIIVIVALVVIGPKDLPRFMHMAGRWMGKARGMADQFRKSFEEMSRQSELDELRAELDSLRHQRPLAETEQALHQPIVPHDMLSGPVEPSTIMTGLPAPAFEGPVEAPEGDGPIVHGPPAP